MKNEIEKFACIKAYEPAEADMEKINALTLRNFTPEEIFTFKVKLCSNEVDRDYESFTAECLNELAELFKGKTGIKDHYPNTDNQVARIFDTKVVTEAEKQTALGEPYTYIEAYCYTPRLPKTADFIAEVEAGIKKEVSVGCSISKKFCSICGKEYKTPWTTGCSHLPGRDYDNVKCVARLADALDAYEFSFVAIPSQRDAQAKKEYTVNEADPTTKPDGAGGDIKTNSLNVFNDIFEKFLS